MLYNKNILILGGNGFLGKHLVSSLCINNFVNAPDKNDCNLLHRQDLARYLTQRCYNYIFHCAQNWNDSDIGKDILLAYNNTINDNIVYMHDMLQPYTVLVTFGSDACYNEHSIEHCEEMYLTDKLNATHEFIGLSKRRLYQQLLNSNSKVNAWIHIVLSSLFGPGFDEEDTHLVHDVIKKLYAVKSTNKIVEFTSSSKQKREILFIDDVVSNIISLLEHSVTGLINLGSEKCVTIEELVVNTSDILDTRSNVCIKIDESLCDNKHLNSEKARNILNKQYSDTSLKESLIKTIEYYKQMVNS
jgi:nucleoside-diphosphate-sugar epimerase